jgi:hypothetical protein
LRDLRAPGAGARSLSLIGHLLGRDEMRYGLNHPSDGRRIISQDTFVELSESQTAQNPAMFFRPADHAFHHGYLQFPCHRKKPFRS